MSAATVLVMAKAPVPGEVKTRLAATVGATAAAHLAHAALLDTLSVCETVFPPGRRVLALAGDLEQSVDPAALGAALTGWQVVGQEGRDLGDRLATAHRLVHSTHGGPVVQIGMDTPHASTEHLADVVLATGSGSPVLGRAHDGGWWVLATTSPDDVDGLEGVAMSRPDTWEHTRDCIRRAAGSVRSTAELADVDTAADAGAAAEAAPHTGFARTWRRVLATAQERAS